MVIFVFFNRKNDRKKGECHTLPLEILIYIMNDFFQSIL